MNDKLIDIAKECGADYEFDYCDESVPSSKKEFLTFTPDQLHAIVEQVYAQRLKELETALAINVECSVYENFVLPTIDAHRAIMGDKK